MLLNEAISVRKKDCKLAHRIEFHSTLSRTLERYFPSGYAGSMG